jgi:hypothetical protein
MDAAAIWLCSTAQANNRCANLNDESRKERHGRAYQQTDIYRSTRRDVQNGTPVSIARS